MGVQLRFLVDGRRRDPNALTGSVLYIRKCSMQRKAGHHLRNAIFRCGADGSLTLNAGRLD